MVNNVIFSQIVTVHDKCMTHNLTDFENFRKIFAAEKCSFQVLLQFIFWTVFPCQDSTSIYGAWKLSFAEILLKYSRTLSKLIFNRLKKVCSHLGRIATGDSVSLRPILTEKTLRYFVTLPRWNHRGAVLQGIRFMILTFKF